MTNEAAVFSPSGTWATFRLAGEMFAVPVEDVQEVLMYQPLTPVPLAPDHIVGLLNLRGQIMAAVDLRRRLQFPDGSREHPGSLVVLKSRGNLVSLLVDEIGDVLALPAESWRPSPDTLPQQHRAFVFGICPIQNDLVLGLRVDTLSGDDDRPQPQAGGTAGVIHA